MKWYQHPNVVDRLAASYVLGTLQGRARHRFEMLMQTQPSVSAAVAGWTERLVPMLTSLPTVKPRAALWKAIEREAHLPSYRSANPISNPMSIAPWWQRWLMPIPALALSMGIALGLLTPVLWQAQTASQRLTQLPSSYVGVLANAQGMQGLIVSSLREGLVVDLKQINPVSLPIGNVLYLWRIDKDGLASPVGKIPNERWAQISLNEPSENVFATAVELAVSMEQADDTPTQPTKAFIYRGLCGKLWPWKAAK
jgi:anti-sigma-K factor RskA